MQVTSDDLRAMGIQLKFKELRPQQQEVLDKIIKSPHRVDVAALPTGVGKSLLAVVYAKLTGLRTVILTSTKALQDQYQQDFSEVSVDVRGMGNYPCRDLENRDSCDVGPCLDGAKCVWRDVGCAYYDHVRKAAEAQIVVTSYAFWFKHQQDAALGTRELVILDEAHELEAELQSAVGTEFRSTEIDFESGAGKRSVEMWRNWALWKQDQVNALLTNPSVTPYDKRFLRGILERLRKLISSPPLFRTWRPGHVRFEPQSVKEFVEPYLMRGAPKVVLLSATVRPAMVQDLGVEDFGYFEADSPFPVEQRPVYWAESGVRLKAGSTDGQLQRWVEKIDEIIEGRLGRKGIVHTVSYKRAEFLEQHSRHAKHMILHQPGQAQKTIKKFKHMKAPAILVSPSVHTGVDFPFEEARWQIIAKIPFPDTRFGIPAKRAAQDTRWSVKRAARTLVQMVGRVVRDEKDMGETFIVDDNIKYILSRYKPLFPRWWREAFQPVVAIPPPVWEREKLSRNFSAGAPYSSFDAENSARAGKTSV